MLYVVLPSRSHSDREGRGYGFPLSATWFGAHCVGRLEKNNEILCQRPPWSFEVITNIPPEPVEVSDRNEAKSMWNLEKLALSVGLVLTCSRSAVNTSLSTLCNFATNWPITGCHNLCHKTAKTHWISLMNGNLELFFYWLVYLWEETFPQVH